MENFIDIVVLLVFIAVLYIALPLLIVWLKDRRGIVGATVSMAIGVVCLLSGVIIILWVAYNLIWPTGEFERSVGSYFAIPFRLLLPIAFIYFGWRWLRNDGPGIEEEKPLASEPELLLARMIAHTRLAEFISVLPTEEHSLAVVLAMAPDPQSAGGAEGLRDVADDFPIWLPVESYRDGEFILHAPDPDGEDDPSLMVSGPWVTSVPESKVLDWQIVDLRDGSIRGAFTIIAVYHYLERKKRALNRRRLEQRAQLLDYSPSSAV